MGAVDELALALPEVILVDPNEVRGPQDDETENDAAREDACGIEHTVPDHEIKDCGCWVEVLRQSP